MRIGLGVCSYRRPGEATDVCNAILAEVASHKRLQPADELITMCSLDDDSFTGYETVREKFGLLWAPNGGVAVNKNRLLRYFVQLDCDVIFLIEDDLRIHESGWVAMHVAALQQTGWGHITWLSPEYRKPLSQSLPLNGLTIDVYGHDVNGVFMVMTKACIARVGGFDEKFGRYGAEHMDYSRRCFHAGIYPPKHPQVREMDHVFSLMPVESALPDAEKLALANAAMNRLITQERARLKGEVGFYVPLSAA